jgi:hypothetical protein
MVTKAVHAYDSVRLARRPGACTATTGLGGQRGVRGRVARAKVSDDIGGQRVFKGFLTRV